MKIFFVGNLASPFIQQDLKMLRADNEVCAFNVPMENAREIATKYPFDLFWNRGKIKGADLVWVWFADAHAIPIIMLAKSYHKPVVVFCGDYEVNNVPEMNYGNQRSMLRGYATRWVLRNVNEILTPSEPFRDTIFRVGFGTRLMDGTFALPEDLEAYPEHIPSISTVPWCINEKEFEGPINKDDLVVTAQFADSTRVRKGIVTFLEATELQPYERYAITRVPRPMYCQSLRAAKVYCQLTYPPTESFGVSLLEDMYCGCVPVITNCPALEWVAGGTGITVQYGNVLQTREAIARALDMDAGPAMRRAREFTYERRLKAVREVVGHYS